MLGRGGAAPLVVYSSPPLTPLFIGEGARGADPSRWDLEGGRRPGRVGLPPKQGGAPLRVPPPTLGAWALGGCGAPAHLGWFPSPYSP